MCLSDRAFSLASEKQSLPGHKPYTLSSLHYFWGLIAQLFRSPLLKMRGYKQEGKYDALEFGICSSPRQCPQKNAGTSPVVCGPMYEIWSGLTQPLWREGDWWPAKKSICMNNKFPSAFLAHGPNWKMYVDSIWNRTSAFQATCRLSILSSWQFLDLTSLASSETWFHSFISYFFQNHQPLPSESTCFLLTSKYNLLPNPRIFPPHSYWHHAMPGPYSPRSHILLHLISVF